MRFHGEQAMKRRADRLQRAVRLKVASAKLRGAVAAGTVAIRLQRDGQYLVEETRMLPKMPPASLVLPV